MECGARNIFDAFHQLNKKVVAVTSCRGKAHAAITHDDRGHAMPARRADFRVPRDLAVVVGVNINPTRGNHQVGGIDLLGADLRNQTNRGDLAIDDANVSDS